MNKYRDIKTLAELDAAIVRSNELVALREKQLKRRYEKARSFYTPSTLVAEGGRRLVSRFRLSDIALFLLRKFRGK